MKKVSITIVFALLLFACQSKEDEQMINSTLYKFYNILNNNNFNDLNKICSPNMNKEIKFWKSLGKDKVKYSSVKVTFIEIKGEKAIANVSTIDEFGNEISFMWNLMKIQNNWKIDNYTSLKNNSIEHFGIIPNKNKNNVNNEIDNYSVYAEEEKTTQSNTTK